MAASGAVIGAERATTDHGATVALLFVSGDTGRDRFAVPQALVEAFGGRVLDPTVESVPASFPGPSAALACARALLRTSGELRIGIHCGEPLAIEEGRLFGTAVWTAARLCGRAEPGRIVLSATAATLLPESRRRPLTSAGSVRLRGLAEPVEVFEDDSSGRVGREAPPSGEVRVVTMLSVDQVGSTALLDGLGDVGARPVHTALMDVLREAIDEHRGTEVEYGGDGLTVRFDSALSALDCATTMQRTAARHSRRFPGAALVLRAAVVSGETDGSSPDALRRLLLACAELISQSGAGEVLVSPVTASLAADRRDHRFASSGDREAVRLDWHPVAVDRALPPDLREAEVFVGRERDLDRLMLAWTATLRSGQRVVLIDGPAGMGKTALAARFARLVAEQEGAGSATVLYGRAAEVETRPLEALTDAVSELLAGSSRADLRRLLGEHAPVLTAILPAIADRLPATESIEVPEPARVATWARSLGELLDAVSGEAPVLLILDDLQHAPPSLVTALRVLAEGAPARRLLLVGLHRPSDGARIGVEAAFRDAAARGAEVTVQSLDGLEREETAELVAEVTGAPLEPEALRALELGSGGRPRFVIEFALARLRADARGDAHRTFRDLTTDPGTADVRRLTRQVLQLERLREDPAEEGAGADRSLDANPYPGLAPFDEGSSARFFGRERMTAELIARVGTSSLSAVIGPSGSGKSSLVRAGLLPALARDVLPGSSAWAVVRMVPGSQPVDALAAAIADRLGGDTAAVHAGLHRGTLPEVVVGLHAVGGRLLLIVDQAEELFTSAGSAERDRFAEVLEGAVSGAASVAVVLVQRAEFYGSWSAYPKLAELLERNHLLMRAMTDTELRRAVEEPALRSGLVVEPALVDTVVADVTGEPGALPLLSTAMSATWDHRRGRRLTLRAYAETGGVRRAVAQLADSAYAALSEDQRPIARALLLRLAQPGGEDSALDLRRRAPLDEVLGLGPGATAVLHAFVECRLVVEDDGTVEVAHEALMREWPLLRGWLDEDRTGRVVQQALAVDARDWRAGGEDPSLLYRGARLARATELAAAGATLATTERSFLAASASDAADSLARARRTAIRLRRLAVGLVVVLVVALVVAGIAVAQGRAANDSATAAQANAVTAQANGLAGTQQDLAGLLALAADRAHPTPAAESAVVGAANRTPDLQRVLALGGAGATTAAISTDGNAAGVISRDGTVGDFDLRTGKRLGSLLTTGATAATPVSVSSAGRYLAVAAGGELRVLDTSSRHIEVEKGDPSSLTFLADGTLAELDPAGTTTSFIDPASGASVPLHTSQDGGLTLVSSDGRTEAWSDTTIATTDQPLFQSYGSPRTHVVDVATTRQIGATIDGALAGMSSDGRLLAVVRDPDVLIVTAATGAVIRSVDIGASLNTPQVVDMTPAAAIAFDPSSSRVAFEGDDAGDPVHLVDVSTGAVRTEPVPFAHTVGPPAFDGSGRLIVRTVGGPAVLVPAAMTPARPVTATGVARQEYAPSPRAFVATSPTGSRAVAVIPPATKGGPDRYRITPTGAPGSGPILPADRDHLFDEATAAFSADGQRLATLEWSPGSGGGAEIVVWDTTSGRRLEAIGPLTSVPPEEDGLELNRIMFLNDSELAAVTPTFRPDTTGTGATVLDVWRLGGTPAPPIVASGLDETQLAAFSPDGGTLATLSVDALDIWSTRTGHLDTTAPVPGYDVNQFSDLRFSPDGRSVVAGSSSGIPEAVDRWQLATPQRPTRVTLPTTARDHGWAVSPDGTTIADVGPSGIEIRSFATGRVEAEAESATSSDQVLAFTRDGDAVVVWNGSQLQVVDRTGDVAQLGPPTTAPPTTVWNDDPDVVATRSGVLTSVTTGDSLVVHAYITRAADAAKRVCTIAGRDLSAAEWSKYLPGVAPVRLCGTAGR